MPIFGRKEKHYDEEEVKQAINSDVSQTRSVPVDYPRPTHREAIRQQAQSYDVTMQQPQPVVVHHQPQPVYNPNLYKREYEKADLNSAPLFVKIEKYREIVASIHELKRFVAGIKQLFVVMNEIQGIQQDATNMMRAHVQRLDKSLEWIDHSLLRPTGFEEPDQGEHEIKQIEHSLTELQREISNLRKDLDRIG